MDEIKQRWIRLFQHNDRSNLEENLNRFLQEFPDSEIKVWTENDLWFAQAIYSYLEGPTYCRKED